MWSQSRLFQPAVSPVLMWVEQRGFTNYFGPKFTDITTPVGILIPQTQSQSSTLRSSSTAFIMPCFTLWLCLLQWLCYNTTLKTTELFYLQLLWCEQDSWRVISLDIRQILGKVKQCAIRFAEWVPIFTVSDDYVITGYLWGRLVKYNACH